MLCHEEKQEADENPWCHFQVKVVCASSKIMKVFVRTAELSVPACWTHIFQRKQEALLITQTFVSVFVDTEY